MTEPGDGITHNKEMEEKIAAIEKHCLTSTTEMNNLFAKVDERRRVS